jgi:hypothetical protein
MQHITGKKIKVRADVTLIRFHDDLPPSGLDLTPITTVRQKLIFDFDLDWATWLTLQKLECTTMPSGVMIVDHETRRGSFIEGSDWDTLADQLVESGLASYYTPKNKKGFG